MSKCKPTFNQPWRLIYFADEATSGNLLRRDPAKKAWCIYFTWVEMGTALMSMDISWIYGGTIHLNKVKEVDGGFGTVFKHHMDYFFGQQCDLRNGITIHTADSEVLMLFSTLGMVLADEAGTKEIWGLKGSGSWRPCALCANVVNARFGFEEHVTRDIVLHTETDPRKLKLHTDESVFAIIDKLQEASISKARCAELEKTHGFHHQPHGVLQCLQLRSVVKPSCISYDFMHCFLTNGVADYELQLYWRECLSQELLTLQAMQNWMECFIWPQRIRKPKTMWSAYHTGEEEYYGGGASNLLSFYPAFRDMITRVIPAHVLAPQTSSLLSLFRVLDGWAVYQQTSRVPPRWQEHIHTWMQLTKVAWPDST